MAAFILINGDHIPPEAWDVICHKFDCKPSEAREALASALNAWRGTQSSPWVDVDSSTLKAKRRLLLTIPLYSILDEA